METKDIFLYHLDNELQKLFRLNRYNYKLLYTSFKLIVRVAFLVCTKKILIPASNYFESDIAFKVLNELQELNDIDAISLISSSHNIDALLQKKISQHGNNISLPHYHYVDFLNESQGIALPGTLKKREQSATTDIKSEWYSIIADSPIKNKLFNLSLNTTKASQFEDILYEIPHKLGERAYISDYILPMLPIDTRNKEHADYILNCFITREYIASFLKEFDAVCLKDIPIIDSSMILPNQSNSDDVYLSYAKIATYLKLTKYKGHNALSFIENCTAYELIEFKHSLEWKAILEKLICGNENVNSKLSEGDIDMDKYNDIKIGIITALPKECAAMKAMLQDVNECFFKEKGAGHRFFIGKINSANGKTHKIALAQCGMGNNQAAIRATNMLSHFQSIESIIMVGIAGGIPSFQKGDNCIRLGDIVVSQGVTQYDFIKEKPDAFECRSKPPKPSAQLLEAIDIMKTYEFEGNYPWHKYIDDFSCNTLFAKPPIDTDLLYDINDNLCEHMEDNTRTSYPKVFMGGIASANVLLKNPVKRNELKQLYNVLAVEMEASGIADATWNQSAGYLVVRGICDYCDTHKNDLWQEYAALVAAAYTRAIIETLPSF